MSRLVIDMTVEQHQQIKTLAAMRGKTIKAFVLEQIFPIKKTQEEQEAWEELQNILSTRIENANNGRISKMSFDQITDDVIQQRN